MMRTLATLALCTVLSGCLVSLHPLSSQAKAAPDAQLYGAWVAHDEGEHLVYLHVGPGKKGMTEALWVEYDKDATFKVSRYTAFPTRLERMNLLNVTSPEEHRKTGGYDIVQYRVDGDRYLSLALLSEDAVKQDIAAGKLKGKVEPGTFGDTTVTASGEQLLSYIEAGDPSRLFPHALRFERAADPGGK